MNGYVAACYAITILTLVGYSAWTIRRYVGVTRARLSDRETNA